MTACRERNAAPARSAVTPRSRSAQAAGDATRSIVWSRRNGPWSRVRLLLVGAAPGNAGGRGSGEMGAHGTRIPFGGDIAGGNLDVLLASVGFTRNDTFIVAAFNQLPERGGGEPTLGEMSAPVGAYPDSVALLRDTVIAAGPDLIVALGNVALRALTGALTREYVAPVGEPPKHAAPVQLLSMDRLARAGLQRGVVTAWPAALLPMATGFRSAWQDTWHTEPTLHVVQLMHPSAQNMSPFAGEGTVFHRRMVETKAALAAAVEHVFGRTPRVPRPAVPAEGGIYDLPEWRERIAPRHQQVDELWRRRGV